MKHLGRKISCFIIAMTMCSCIPLHAVAATEAERQADQVIYLTNLQRVSAGLSPLYTAPSLTTLASIRANELPTVFDHNRPDGSRYYTVLDNAGIRWVDAGENIAFESEGTAESVMNIWLKSNVHRENIFATYYNYMAVSLAQDSEGTYYWVQLFMYTGQQNGAYLPENQFGDSPTETTPEETTTTTTETTTTTTETTTTTATETTTMTTTTTSTMPTTTTTTTSTMPTTTTTTTSTMPTTTTTTTSTMPTTSTTTTSPMPTTSTTVTTSTMPTTSTTMTTTTYYIPTETTPTTTTTYEEPISDGYQFFLMGQYGGNGFWNAGENNNPAVTVTEDNREYTVAVKNSGVTSENDLVLILQSNVNIYDYGTENETGGYQNGIENGRLDIEVTSIKVDGQEIAYQRSENPLNVDNNGTSLRLNLHNKWGYPAVTDISPNLTINDGIEVTFKTHGLFLEPPFASSLTGDINNDGSVNVEDATVILIDAAASAVSGISQLTEEQVAHCDFDGDGVCNAIDASYVLQYAAFQGAGGALSVPDWYAEIK